MEDNLIENYDSKESEQKDYNNFYERVERNNNAEETITTQVSSNENSKENQRPNFAEKQETKNEVLEFFLSGFFSEFSQEKMDAVELYKNIDNYLYESSLKQYSKKQNMIFYQPKSRNFISYNYIKNYNKNYFIFYNIKNNYTFK